MPQHPTPPPSRPSQLSRKNISVGKNTKKGHSSEVQQQEVGCTMKKGVGPDNVPQNNSTKLIFNCFLFFKVDLGLLAKGLDVMRWRYEVNYAMDQ